MIRYIIVLILSLAISVLSFGQKAPEINVYPPQMHQQICRESTFIRYLQIFNTGDSTLYYDANLLDNDVSWVTTTPHSGQVEPGDTSLIEFDFNSSGLPLNNYFDTLHISNNDPENPELNVITMLHVQDLTIIINPEEDSICLGCSTELKTFVFGCSGFTSFSWASEPVGFTSVEMSPVVNPQVTTTYTITVTDGNYSGQKSVDIKVTPSSGINENSLVSDVSVFPNPFSNDCVLKFYSEFNGKGIISIIDIAGSVNLTIPVSLNNGLNELPVHIPELNPGAYVLSLRTEDKPGQSRAILKKIFIY